jgi:hypothetical protein
MGEVGGMTTILLTPAKLLAVMAGPWQASQFDVMPVWLMADPLNLAPLPTGTLAMLEPGPTWQVSQAALVGRWLAGGATMEKLLAGTAKLAAAVVEWHCAQLAVVLGALAWMLARVGITLKSFTVWQAEHSAALEVGMWLAGLDSSIEK